MGTHAAAKIPSPPQMAEPQEAPLEPTIHIVGAEKAGEWIRPLTVWRHRELLYFFTLRDLKLRYKQTALGAIWTILQPLLTSGVFTLFFAKVARLPSDGFPYPLFVVSGILPWNYFANALVRASTSLVGNGHLISKIYFPRYLIPLASLLPGLVDFAIALTVVVPLMLIYQFLPPVTVILAVPALTLLAFTLAFGCGLWLSAINVKYRDVGNILPFMMQLWMFATPIIYPIGMVPESYRWAVQLNPVTGIILGFRGALLGAPWELSALTISVITSLTILFTGAAFFRNAEGSFADSV